MLNQIDEDISDNVKRILDGVFSSNSDNSKPAISLVISLGLGKILCYILVELNILQHLRPSST